MTVADRAEEDQGVLRVPERHAAQAVPGGLVRGVSIPSVTTTETVCT